MSLSHWPGICNRDKKCHTSAEWWPSRLSWMTWLWYRPVAETRGALCPRDIIQIKDGLLMGINNVMCHFKRWPSKLIVNKMTYYRWHDSIYILLILNLKSKQCCRSGLTSTVTQFSSNTDREKGIIILNYISYYIIYIY